MKGGLGSVRMTPSSLRCSENAAGLPRFISRPPPANRVQPDFQRKSDQNTMIPPRQKGFTSYTRVAVMNGGLVQAHMTPIIPLMHRKRRRVAPLHP